MLDDMTQATQIAELESDNRRLRRLLDQRDAPAELRHRLRSTLSILRAVIRKTADTCRDIEQYVAHLQDRLDALARAQAAIDEQGSVGLHSLIADEFHTYGVSEGKRGSINGPDVELEPKAGMMIALAIHELAVNAVEYGALGSNTGRIDVEWTVSAGATDALLALTWKEQSHAGPRAPSQPGFGTEVLSRMLPYELKAAVLLVYESDGLLCTIHLPLPRKVGWSPIVGNIASVASPMTSPSAG